MRGFQSDKVICKKKIREFPADDGRMQREPRQVMCILGIVPHQESREMPEFQSDEALCKNEIRELL
jgi:hypothetical protein